MEIDNLKLAKILETATIAARAAGQKAIELISYVKTSAKSAQELVTEADMICQNLIIDTIKHDFPDHGFIGEESSDNHLLKIPPRGEDFWWIIDPIDGTNNYSYNLPCFTVSIGIISENQPIAGVIFNPATDSLFSATIASPAKLNNHSITCSSEKISPYSMIGIDGHYSDEIPQWQIEIMLKTKFRNFGTTALQMAYVASGSLAATVSHYPKLYDIAAGYIIAKQAGAVITDYQGNDIMPVNPAEYDREAFEILLAHPKNHKTILEMIKLAKN